MNSVALPASSTPGLSAEADLVRQAARGDADAFGELFRRHGSPAWRLAQAVSADRDAAISSFREGFVRSVRSGRFTRKAATAFRPLILASVYRAALDQAHQHTAAGPSRRAVAAGPDAALADAAFRSLPERWRAAVWLRDVENFEPERIAVVLGVSTSVAEQLVTRGRRGLAGRYAQAHRDAPEHVGEVLRPLALSMPANLAELAVARWAASRADHIALLAPVTGWLEDRAVRPMSVAVGALVGLGLIGLGVVSGGSTVRSNLGASSNGSIPGSVPVRTCLGVACPAGNIAFGSSPSGLNLLSASFPAGSGPIGATGTGTTFGAGAVSPSAGSPAGSPGGSGGGSNPPPSGGSNPIGGLLPPAPPPPTTPPTPTLPPLPPLVPGGTTTVGVPGVATVTSTNSGTTGVNLLNGTGTVSLSTGSTPSLSVGSGGATTTVTVPTSSGSSNTSLSGTLSNTTKTLTTTVSTLLGGL